jgi:hypothetical protein
VVSWGLCVHLPSSKRHYWTSDDEADRKIAKAYCCACPAPIACAEWALKDLPQWDDCIYGGLDVSGRRRLWRGPA